MENKTKLRFFENAWRTDLLTKTEIFRSMLEPYTEEELKELTEDKLVETYNQYADTYLDLIMKRCIGSEGFKIFLNLSKDRTIIERRYGNVSNYDKTHSEIKILNGSEYEWFRDSDKLYVENMRRLYNEQDIRTIITWRTVYECMENCMDLCEHAADVVSTVIMKNS